MALWAGRFSKEIDAGVNAFNSSISFDARMYRQDIEGSQAHAAIEGRDYVIPGDVREVFARCVEHRLILTPRAQTQGILPGDVLERIVQSVPAPKLR